MNKRIAIMATLSLCAAGLLSAQESSPLNDTLALQESVVASLKIGRSVEETAASITVVNSLDIKKHSSNTISDVLKFEPGLSMGGDGVWSTNINVRGFGENRLVTLVDGIRVETATDLTASLGMIDVNDIERVEVIKGAQSSIYGSGAMGGIVNVISRDGYFAGAPYFHGNVSANFNSANRGGNGYLSFYAGGRKWYAKLNGKYAHAGDIRTPEGLLGNSGYNSTDMGARLGVKLADNHILRLQFQRDWSYDVGIPGGSSFSPVAIATYKNIGRTLLNAKYEVVGITDSFEALRVNAFLQKIVRDVEVLPNASQPRSGVHPTRLTPYAVHTTYGANVESVWKWGDVHSFVAGADVWRRNMTSDRKKYINQYADGTLKQQMIRNEMPLPSASFTSAGLFAQYEARFLDGRFIATLGGRFDVNSVQNEEVHNVESVVNVTTGSIDYNPAGKYVTFASGNRADASWSGNLGIRYKVCPHFDVMANASRSYRSAALEELFKFIDLSGNRVHFGNPNLKAESGISADLGIRANGVNYDFKASFYVNHINNMIVERKVNANPASVNDTLVLDNASKAVTYGTEFKGTYTFVRGLSVYLSGGITVGMETSLKDTWLPSIPPANCRMGMTYENSRIAGADFSILLVGSRKEAEIAEGEIATDAYCRLDLSVHSKVFVLPHCSLQLFGGIDNVADRKYVNFLSTNRGERRCEPGRNIYIRVNVSF